jgi:leucine dehydrogenase
MTMARKLEDFSSAGGSEASRGAVFGAQAFDNHEQVVFCADRESGLSAIIAIHDTALGPALGGCRMWPYASEEEALTDALRLSRGMTYKNAVAGLDLGGGKSVIVADAHSDKSEAMIRSFARQVDRLAGRYITAEDVGISIADVDVMAQETAHVRGTTANGLGDPSPYTAWGVFHGLRAAARAAFGSDDLTGRHVAVQGVGQVGLALCRHLHEAGARLTVADVYEPNLQRARQLFGAEVVPAETIHAAECDVFAPCALGAALNPATVGEIKAKVVAGSANNQLAAPSDGLALFRRGILYAPDYVINAGGVISIGAVEEAPSREAMLTRIAKLDEVLTEIFARSRRETRPPEVIADRIAEERLAAAR